mgnify:CR=1 FL=1
MMMIARCYFQNKTYLSRNVSSLLNCRTILKRAKHQSSITNRDQVFIDNSHSKSDSLPNQNNDATNYFGFKPVTDEEKFEKGMRFFCFDNH